VSKPFFSIVIPCYNRLEAAKRAVESCLSQSYSDLEVILVDDCSKDDMSQLKAEFSDVRFKFIRLEKNGGACNARNVGVENSSGKYIAFLDSDDVFLPEKLHVYHKQIQLDNYCKNTLYFSSLFVDRGFGKRIVRPQVTLAKKELVMDYIFVRWGMISTITMVLPRALAIGTPFTVNLKRHQDYDFCLNLEKKGILFHMIEQPLSVFYDCFDPNRISMSTGYKSSKAWFDLAEDKLSEDAKNAYLGRVLAPMMNNKVKAIKNVWKAYRTVNSISFSELFVLFIKTCSPKFYRYICTLYMRFSGI